MAFGVDRGMKPSLTGYGLRSSVDRCLTLEQELEMFIDSGDCMIDAINREVDIAGAEQRRGKPRAALACLRRAQRMARQAVEGGFEGRPETSRLPRLEALPAPKLALATVRLRVSRLLMDLGLHVDAFREVRGTCLATDDLWETLLAHRRADAENEAAGGGVAPTSSFLAHAPFWLEQAVVVTIEARRAYATTAATLQAAEQSYPSFRKTSSLQRGSEAPSGDGDEESLDAIWSVDAATLNREALMLAKQVLPEAHEMRRKLEIEEEEKEEAEKKARASRRGRRGSVQSVSGAATGQGRRGSIQVDGQVHVDGGRRKSVQLEEGQARRLSLQGDTENQDRRLSMQTDGGSLEGQGRRLSMQSNPGESRRLSAQTDVGAAEAEAEAVGDADGSLLDLGLPQLLHLKDARRLPTPSSPMRGRAKPETPENPAVEKIGPLIPCTPGDVYHESLPRAPNLSPARRTPSKPVAPDSEHLGSSLGSAGQTSFIPRETRPADPFKDWLESRSDINKMTYRQYLNLSHSGQAKVKEEFKNESLTFRSFTMPSLSDERLFENRNFYSDFGLAAMQRSQRKRERWRQEMWNPSEKTMRIAAQEQALMKYYGVQPKGKDPHVMKTWAKMLQKSMDRTPLGRQQIADAKAKKDEERRAREAEVKAEMDKQFLALQGLSSKSRAGTKAAAD